MALSFACTTPQGFDVSSCYARIEDVHLASKTEIHFRLVYYKDAGQSVSFRTDDGLMCAYAIDGENPIKQAYAFLKAKPEFASAIDILEDEQESA
ncbi:hypothetical protein [Burkholderia anthina]|uniref:hypothetical protein n=1 Tax=Burkholderia anthina TaxID=179879 RepID=UPI001AA0540B|nr:hypothetical protein [Burkholderia anthina]QTD89474.1 hypothetical protein J4G50_17015 [Burkholderia anthina]